MFYKIAFSIFLLSTTIVSSHATPGRNIEEVEQKFSSAPQYRSFPARLHFESTVNRTGAGILHYADGPDGPMILLGHRNDDDSWCNLGGMSDADKNGKGLLKNQKSQTSSDLAETASREAEEESNGYFAHHPHTLRRLPFIDTLNERKGLKAFLYRMYFKKVAMVDTDNLIKAQEEAENYHNKEYRNFKWIPAETILYALILKNNNIDLGEEQIKLFQPLFQTLRTPAGQVLLTNIVANSKILRFSKTIRPLLNRVYDVRRRKAKEDYCGPVNYPTSQFEPHHLPIQSEADKAQLAYSVAAHGAAMIELKVKSNLRSTEDESLIPTNSNEKTKLPLSQIHLRMALGDVYKSAEHFSGQDNAQRLANLANIEEYFKRYASTDEFRRPINYTSDDIKVFADILEWEEKHKGKATFYHASTADLHSLWKSFTFLRELLSLSPLVGNKVMMRGTDIYFRDVKTMGDIIKKYGYRDYGGRELLVLSTNCVLMAGLNTTSTSSSSVEYFLNNHSATTPNIARRFEETTALAGINAQYSYFKSPFLQYLTHQNPSAPNSVMIRISAPFGLLPIHAYAAHGGGREFSPDITKTLEMIQDAENRLNDDDKNNKVRNLISEARLSLHPAFSLHPQVEIKAFNRFPLTASQQKEFDQEMRNTAIATLADWLKSQHKVMPDSYINYPVLKQLFGYVWKGITGGALVETFAYESFTHLLSNGCIEGAREFLIRFHEALNHEGFYSKDILRDIIQFDQVDLLKFLLEDLIKLSVKSFFVTHQDFEKTVQVCRACDSWQVLNYLLSNYELTSINPQVANRWVVRLLLNTFCSPTHTINYVLAKHFPHVKKEVEEALLEEENATAITRYIKISGTSLVEILQEILKKEDGVYTFFDILGAIEGNVSTFFSDSDSLAKILAKVSFYQNLDLLVKRGIEPEKVAKAALTILNSASHSNKMIEYFAFANFAQQHNLILHKLNGIDASEINKFLENYIVHLFPNGNQDTPKTLIALGFDPQTIIETMKNVIKDDRFVRYYSDMLSPSPNL